MATDGTKRILVVDDDISTRMVVRKIFENASSARFEVHEAVNGAECVKTVRCQPPFDLILLDVEMPGMNGFEACRALRQIDAAVPVVFVTSHSDLEKRKEGRAAGGSSFLPKPVPPVTLLTLVNKLAVSES